MLNILTAAQIRLADKYTIDTRPIASIDLMEAAARAFVSVFKEIFPRLSASLAFYCGTGNNGGDGLAIARLLKEEGYQHIMVRLARFSEKSTPDFDINLQRLYQTGLSITEIEPGGPFHEENAEIIFDALIGSGLNKPLAGDLERLVRYINSLHRSVVAIDIPSGFFSEGPLAAKNTVVKADLAITFQRPKINFLLPESAVWLNEFVVADIGLDEEFIQSLETSYLFLTRADIQQILHKRTPFSHKGTYGHAMIIAGNDETMGAALLSSGACLYTGAGLTTACIPSGGLTALNSLHPEIMAVLRDKIQLSEIKWDKYQSLAIGPGLGTSVESKNLLEVVLKKNQKPLVIDADAINLIATHYELMAFVPEGAVFTPHVKEFDRLFGKHESWWDRLQTGMDRAKTLGCVIVLKNRYSIIFTPDGKCIFNPTGNPAMATGGMGDVLTGMIASFLAQGYSPEKAAILGTYIHGKAGNELLKEKQLAVIPATLLVQKLPEIIGTLSTKNPD